MIQLKRKYMSRLKVALSLVLAVSVVVFIIGCPGGTPSFPGGIRVLSFEAIIGIPGSAFPLPNVGCAGDIPPGGILGPGPGSAVTFSGNTGALAFADFPFCRLNANWEISASFLTSAIPGCGTTRNTFYAPSTGLEVSAICLVF